MVAYWISAFSVTWKGLNSFYGGGGLESEYGDWLWLDSALAKPINKKIQIYRYSCPVKIVSDRHYCQDCWPFITCQLFDKHNIGSRLTQHSEVLATLEFQGDTFVQKQEQG